MSSGPFPIPSTPERLERLRSEVQRIIADAKQSFTVGRPAAEVSVSLAEQFDQFVIATLEATRGMIPTTVAADIDRCFTLIAVGGSGRKDPCPYSDLDLLFLVDPSMPSLGREWIEQFIRDLWDSGLKLGHSVRSVKECISTALDDIQFATSLIQMRFLWGNASAFEDLQQRYRRKVVRSRWRVFCELGIAGREEEQEKHGGAVLSLVPDVKKSRGGLRDWHLITWLLFAEFDTHDPRALARAGLLSDDEIVSLQHAVEYLTRIRMDLHFAAGKPQDVLTRDEQLRLAEAYGVQATMGQRPVERFMQSYFRYSSQIARVAERLSSRFVTHSLTDRIIGYVASHRADHRYLVRWDGIDVLPKYREEFLRSPEQIMRLFTLSALYGLAPKPDIVVAIRRSLPTIPFTLTDEIIHRFVRILKTSIMLGPTLRSMDEAGLLERIIPDFAHAHFLLQFNQYHAYTVDEHTFRAVEILTSFARDTGPIGKVYKSIPHKEVVHLAMILHDLGKGFSEDHSEVGKRIADRIGPRLQLTELQQEQVSLLVLKHLVMANTAFWRDIADPRVLLDFSRVVGSIEVLKMLYVLTAADVSAVGPGVWTDWKAGLLTELYRRTYRVLAGEGDPLQENEIRSDRKVQVLAILLHDSSVDPIEEEEWLNREFDTLPLTYLIETTPEQIATDLDQISRLQPRDVAIEASLVPDKQMVEYRVLVSPEYSQGCFHRITGALTAMRMEIATAQICTTTKGIVVDRFLVSDPDFTGEIPLERLNDVRRALLRVIKGEQPVKELFAQRNRFTKRRTPTPYADQPTRLNIDNESSERCTVIEVFTLDRHGLLFELAQVIFEAGLSVELAKIGTHMEQVVDVFYVTDDGGGKLVDETRFNELKSRLDDVLKRTPPV